MTLSLAGRSDAMYRKLLLTPGPTPVPEDVLEAMSRPVMHHRHPEFMGILGEVKEELKHLFQTKGDVLIFSASGTGAMEGAIVNLLCRGDKAIVVRAGKFGERWAEICETYGVQVINIDVEWGRAINPGEVKKVLEREADVRAVFIQASETSTGVRHPVQEVGALVADRDQTVMVVDAITGIGVFDIPVDEWSLDVVVTGSQKALMLPPGLSFASVSEKAWRVARRADLPKYYFDFAKEKKNLAKNQTSYTSSVSLILGLQASLARIRSEGLQNVFSRTERLARATRAGVLGLGLELFAPECPSPALTAVRVPRGIDGGKLTTIMRDRYGVAIAGGQGELKGKIFRIAHMGFIQGYDIIAGLVALELTLRDLGYPVTLGTSIQAAESVLSQ